MIYVEIGVGNEFIVSTELEDESRVRFVPIKIKDLYLRFWIGKKVLILSLKDGIKVVEKSRKSFKALIGAGGDRR